MKLKQVTAFLIIACTLFCTSSCNSDDGVEGSITLGDQSGVDFYYEFPDKEMTLLSDEPFEDGRKIKYANFFDLNDDSFNDIIFVYEYFVTDVGDGYYFLRIDLPNTIQLAGALANAFGNVGLFPLLMPANESLGVNSSVWTSFNDKTYLFYFDIDNHLEVERLNVFSNSDDTYLPFKIDGVDEKGMGWIHIEPTSEAWRPRLLDIGYKRLN